MPVCLILFAFICRCVLVFSCGFPIFFRRSEIISHPLQTGEGEGAPICFRGTMTPPSSRSLKQGAGDLLLLGVAALAFVTANANRRMALED